MDQRIDESDMKLKQVVGGVTFAGALGAAALGHGRRGTAAAGVGPTAPPAWRALGLWPDQLLGLPGNALLEPRFQPMGIRLLRSVDSAVKITRHDGRLAGWRGERRRDCWDGSPSVWAVQEKPR